MIKEIVQTECLPASLTYQYVIIFLCWKVFKELRPKTVILVMLPLTLSIVPARVSTQQVCISEINGIRFYGTFFPFSFKKQILEKSKSQPYLPEATCQSCEKEEKWLKECVLLSLPKMKSLNCTWWKKKNSKIYVWKWCTCISGNTWQYARRHTQSHRINMCFFLEYQFYQNAF